MKGISLKECLIFAGLLFTVFFVSNVYSETRRFHNPQVSGVALDWCLTWASNCGKPAADNFCRWKGYSQAAGYREAVDIGYTKILRTGKICNASFCDGFAYIDCEKSGGITRFDYPTIRGYRLDWCRRWATDCGRGAANSFCRSKGLSRAKSWKEDPDIGQRSATYVIETGKICDQGFCDGFRYIVCE